MDVYVENRFNLLSDIQKHKRCAELLRRAYQDPQPEIIETYKQLYCWLKSPFGEIASLTAKTLADLYHQHLQAAGMSHKEHNLLSPQRRGDFNTPKEPWPIDIYLDNLRSAHNVGSILRTIEALSLGTVYFSPNTPYIDNPKVEKTSMGSIPTLQCHKNFPLQTLRKPIIALETSEKAQNLYQFTFPTSFTLVVGNEEYGCSDTTLEQAEIILEIPLRGKKNSLNVANAFACVASEISRQKEQG